MAKAVKTDQKSSGTQDSALTVFFSSFVFSSVLLTCQELVVVLCLLLLLKREIKTGKSTQIIHRKETKTMSSSVPK